MRWATNGSRKARAAGYPVLAGVPESSTLGATGVDMGATESEAFRMLRARLRYFNVDRSIRTLLITSEDRGDGKTTVARNIAMTAAAGGTKVLLIDADLRRPAVARALNLGSPPGLAEVLTHDIPLSLVIQQVPVPSWTGADALPLDVIASGQIPPNPAELLESRKMAAFLEQLSNEYELVVVDTPPIAVVADAIPLLTQVSGVVAVSRIGKNTRDGVLHLREQLTRLGAPVLGIVANGLSSRNDSKYY